MKILVGESYRDGWGQSHKIIGEVPDKPGEFWADTGYRFMTDGRMQFRVGPELSKFDLVDPMYADACHATLEFNGAPTQDLSNADD